jgi:uncharacterized membrane protein
MKNIINKKLIDKAFELGILIKSIFGFFEILAGIILAISGKLVIDNLIIVLTKQEILEDPSDFIADYLIKASNSLAVGSHFFAVIYLIFHGVVNIFLAISLLKNKIWAYPWAIVGFSVFIIYQIFRYIHTFSPLLLILIVFDLFVVTVIWLEYKRKKNK